MSVPYVYDRRFSLSEATPDCGRRLRAVLPLIEEHASGAEVFAAMLTDETRLWVFKSVWRETQKRKPLSLFDGGGS